MKGYIIFFAVLAGFNQLISADPPKPPNALIDLCLTVKPGMTEEQVSNHFGKRPISPIFSAKYFSSASIQMEDFYANIYFKYENGSSVVDRKVYFVHQKNKEHDIGYQIQKLPLHQQHFFDTCRREKGETPLFELKPSERPAPLAEIEVWHPPFLKANEAAMVTRNTLENCQGHR